ncbi:ABC transporter ATP-binding protein [Herbiconiux daphne]|uniref:ABC transporter ATP-binding protein n=1 Tax=Herbiconiux daphne TaxID=2970914 RepID=A0ABT2H755_9MICO|nr:ABC transporter ATP-binding protein [Herbiconiux daphne]MCS5735744.1 ABC transporter ATP-binding protein [Herbiconiux daphne]
MTEVVVSGLTKKYGAKAALHGLDVRIRSGEFVTLLGPSGCGKTTTLRCLAGLEKPTAGIVTMGDRVVVDTERRVFVPPEKRHIGMVFQSYALWPHLTVAENVGYPLRVGGMRGVERRERIAEVLDAVGLAEYGDRSATALSGGQQQRVALARALAARPGIIFYDEPLSNLDTKLRFTMGRQVRSLHDENGMTSVYVTHDQEEAITLSDRIIVMNHGLIEQDGTPEDLYDRPSSAYVADFMGFQNILTGVVVEAGARHADVEVAEGLILRAQVAELVRMGDTVTVAFRASHVHVEPAGSTGVGLFRGEVVHSTFVGSSVDLVVHARGASVQARIERSELERLGLGHPSAGDTLEFRVRASGALVVKGREGQRQAYATEAVNMVA